MVDFSQRNRVAKDNFQLIQWIMETQEDCMLFSCVGTFKKEPVLVCGADSFLHFLSRYSKLHFYSLGTHCEEIWGIQRGAIPFDAGFPIGARASLLAHDFACKV